MKTMLPSFNGQQMNKTVSQHFDGYQIKDWRNFAYNLTSTKYEVCS